MNMLSNYVFARHEYTYQDQNSQHNTLFSFCEDTCLNHYNQYNDIATCHEGTDCSQYNVASIFHEDMDHIQYIYT